MAGARRDRDEVEAALKAKGFIPKNDDHRRFTYWTQAGKKSAIWTKTSHGTKYKVLGDSLISAMAAQCRLTKAQFLQLVDCPMSREQYEATLRTSGSIT